MDTLEAPTTSPALVTPERIATDTRLAVSDTLQPRRSSPVGIQTPTYFVAPLWHTSAGDDAIDLAEVCGIHMLPWQKMVLRNTLGERPGGKWSSFENCLIIPRQNGKNVIILVRQLAGLFLFGEKQQVHTAHKFKTARAAHRMLVDVIDRVPDLAELKKSSPSSPSDSSVTLHNGNRLDFIARQGGSGRGLSGDTVYLDEAFQLSPELVSDLLPTLSAMPAPQLWYTSSAGMETSDVLESVRNRALEAPDKEKFLTYFEWAADLDKHARDTPEAAAMANPSMGYFQDWEWIEGTELRGMEEEQYNRERLGLWHDKAAGAVIGPEVWKNAEVTADDIAGIEIVRRSLAIEVTQDRDLSVIAGAALLEDGRVLVEIIDQKAGTAWLANTAEARYTSSDAWAGIVYDSFSGATAIAPYLIEKGVPVTAATTRDLVTGTADFYDRLHVKNDKGIPAPTLIHSAGGSSFLDDAAFTARRRLVGSSKSAWTWDSGSAEVSLAPLRAVTLALKGLSLEPVKKKKRKRVV